MNDDLIEGTYKDLDETRCIIINKTVDEKIIEGAVLKIWQWNQEDNLIEAELKKYERTPIRIFINSSGGKVLESLSLIGAITTSKTPIETICLGHAYSAAFMIFIVGHKRYVQPYSILMYHDMSGGMQGKSQELFEYAADISELVSIYQSIVKKYTKITQKQLDKWHKEKLDYYIYSPEALKLKCCDDIWVSGK